MEGFLAYPLDELPFVVLVLLMAFTVHEFAHAYSAYRFGDPTAHREGRVTLDPRAHLDIFGTLFLLIAGFGWAKPVPVNRARFKNPRIMGIVVSAAGPLSNLFMGLIGIFIFFLLLRFHVIDGLSQGAIDAVILFFRYFIMINFILCFFNLIPLPPLDGYRIVEDVVPYNTLQKLRSVEQWSVYVFLLIVFIPPLNRIFLGPLNDIAVWIYEKEWDLLLRIFGAG